MTKHIPWISFFIVASLATASHAGDCNIDGTNYASTAGTPVRTDTNLQFNGTVCGHTVYASSGTCYLEIRNDDSVSSGDCLVLGRGVQITGLDHTLSCTGSSCDEAIDASNSSGSGSTDVDGLNITGCFTRGAASFAQSWPRNFTNAQIDLSGSGCNGTWGLLGWQNISRVVISGTSSHAISTSGTVSDSVVRDCAIGVLTDSATILDNVFLHDNVTTLKKAGGSASLRSSVIATSGSTTCQCDIGGTCQSDVSSCVTFAGDPSIVEDEIRD